MSGVNIQRWSRCKNTAVIRRRADVHRQRCISTAVASMYIGNDVKQHGKVFTLAKQLFYNEISPGALVWWWEGLLTLSPGLRLVPSVVIMMATVAM